MSQVTEIVEQLKANADYHKEVQPVLRKFVTDTTLPLAERFNVWKKFCDKTKAPWIIRRGEFGLIGQWVDECKPYEFDRYRLYDWKHFLEFVKDDPEEAGITEEAFKEMLIETNFGSFYMDW